MKKLTLLAPVTLGAIGSALGWLYLHRSSPTDDLEAEVERASSRVETSRPLSARRTIPDPNLRRRAAAQPIQEDRIGSSISRTVHREAERTTTLVQNALSQTTRIPPASSPSTSVKYESVSHEPSIGTVRVLGHRGCDLNTPGWFLSVGKPEQYDFSVSDDGEMVVVEPNTPELTGNFEFIHCADLEDVLGKHVKFSVRIKAQGVTQTAQLRLRGEDDRRNQNLSAIVKVGGTHDWRDFSLEADVGPEVYIFSYGLTFQSAGKLWIGSPRFEVIYQ